jgi:ABC-type amino acid transport system permease subunit
MKRILIGSAMYMNHFLEGLTQNKEMTAFSAILGTVMGFVFQSFQIDIFLIFGLIAMVAINTWSGIKLARREGRFNLKVLKDSVMEKTVGYLILLISLAVLMIILFVAALKDNTKIVEDYYFNLPVVLLIVFLSSVEFKSTLDNLEALGIKVPGFVKKIPSKIQGKINDITDEPSKI